MEREFLCQKREGQRIIRLICQKNGEEHLGVDVCPAQGFKTFGLRFRGDWLQPYLPRWESLLSHESFGNSVLFPTPNRVRNGVFTFRGRRVEMRKRGVPQTQHGLAWNSPWEVLEQRADADSALLRAEFCIRAGDENYEAFPWECSLQMALILTENALECRYLVTNRDQAPMPFGIGLHPWFLLPEGTEKVRLRLPAETYFETTPDLLPTGRRLPVTEVPGHDLRRFTDVAALDLDTVFETQGRDVTLRYADRGYDLVISVTPDFLDSVVFTAFNRGMEKTGYRAFCVESQTCCTDAINLSEGGLADSGLMVLAPGGTKEGGVVYRFEMKKGGEG